MIQVPETTWKDGSIWGFPYSKSHYDKVVSRKKVVEVMEIYVYFMNITCKMQLELYYTFILLVLGENVG